MGGGGTQAGGEGGGIWSWGRARCVVRAKVGGFVATVGNAVGIPSVATEAVNLRNVCLVMAVLVSIKVFLLQCGCPLRLVDCGAGGQNAGGLRIEGSPTVLPTVGNAAGMQSVATEAVISVTTRTVNVRIVCQRN